MNRSKSKLPIIITIISVILIIIISVGVYLYIKTDFFKTDEELFQRYMLQDVGVINEILDISSEVNYLKLKEENDYTESTTAKLNYTNTEDGEDEYTITEEGIKLNDEKKSYKNININSGETNLINIEYLRENEIYGLHFASIVNEFAAIDTSKNISSLVSYFGLDDIIKSDCVNQVNIADLLECSEEEINNLEMTYLSLILNQISKDNYSSEKKQVITLKNGEKAETNAYKLTLSSSQLQNIILSILKQAQEDEIILGKLENIDNTINQMGLSLDESVKTTFENYIQNKIKNLKIEDGITIELYELNKTVVMTEINYEDVTINMYVNDIEKNDITIEYNNVVSNQTQTTIVSIQKDKENLKLEYEDYKNNKIVLERELSINDGDIKSSVNIQYTDNDEIENLSLELDKEVKIGDKADIPTSFDQVGKRLLNDYSGENLEKAISSLKEKIINSVRNKKDETESVILKYIIDYENKMAEIEKENEENKVKRFNSKFELYEGQDVENSIVLNAIDTAGQNISTYKTDNNQIIIYIKEGNANTTLTSEIKNLIKENAKYNITLKYGDDTRVSEVIIEQYDDQ